MARLHRRYLLATLLFFFGITYSFFPSLLVPSSPPINQPIPPSHPPDRVDSAVAVPPPSRSWLELGKNGRVVVPLDRLTGGGRRGQHPVRLLMDEAKVLWEQKLHRQSRTLEDAIATYRTRYGRSPPKGFDDWYRFAKEKNVVMIDDYDSILTDITPFLALSPSLLAYRLENLLLSGGRRFSFSLRRSQPFKPRIDYKENPARPVLTGTLLEGMRAWLPDDFGEGEEGPVVIAGWDHDMGPRVVNADLRERLLELERQGKYIDMDELVALEDTKRPGSMPAIWNSCSRDSPAGRDYDAFGIAGRDYSREPLTSRPISFLRKPSLSYDFCSNPALTNLHGSLSLRLPYPGFNSTLSPEFFLSKREGGDGLFLTPLEQFKNTSESIPWEEKSVNKIFWRGSTTGVLADSYRQDGYRWRTSHRIRLSKLASAQIGSSDVLVPTSSRDERPVLERYEAKDLNDHLFDFGFSHVNTCEKRTCEEMKKELPIVPKVDPKTALKYKYALDVDGNAWSARFRRLLSSGTPVFKSTIFPEWNSEWLQPWLHYIPVEVDYSDFYNSATYFIGPPGGGRGHDEAGQEISEAAVEFVKTAWRWEDMQAYTYRLLLEYRRMMANDRDAMSLGGRMRS